MITSPEQLITPYERTRAGFLRIALEKNRAATPYVNEAKALKVAAMGVDRPKNLLALKSLRGTLLTAAGLSAKALNHLTEDDKSDAINNLVEQFLEPTGEHFVDELVFRFLLTRGDSLGGKMRNLAGKIAEQTVIRAIIATLSIQDRSFSWLDGRAKKWINGDKNDPQIERNARGVYWQVGELHRTLLLNLTVPLVRKNVDLCLLSATPKEIRRSNKHASRHREPQYYVALGELKGGVDPAGADEHWKTANSALSRIRTGFQREGLTPDLFFIGAAIEKAMATEIYNQLQSSQLSNAANLTDDGQLFKLISWLTRL